MTHCARSSYDRQVRRSPTSAVVVALCALLAGCAAPSNPAAVPEGISVSVYQTRTDVGPRRLEVSIQNGTNGPLTITGVRFESAQFDGAAAWQKDETSIPKGATVDLPVLLPSPDCDAIDPQPEVEFDYELSDGTIGTARTVADDRLDRLPPLMIEDCTAQSVADIVALTIVDPPRRTTVAGMPAFELDVRAEPTGADGSVELVLVSSTTLLMPADPATGIPVTEGRIDRTIDGGDEPSIVTLVLTAGRCDPHALLEDKRGTIMPLDVLVDGVAGRIYLPSADAVRGAIYEVVAQSCGF